MSHQLLATEPAGEVRIVLPNVQWCHYVGLSDDIGDRPTLRLNYMDGNLEVIEVKPIHGWAEDFLTEIIKMIAAIWRIKRVSIGSTTFRRDDLQKGFEADGTFYFGENATHIRQLNLKVEINLLISPPPDLLIEVDVTSGSLNKLPMYARIGVRELWWHRQGQLRIYTLLADGSGYEEAQASANLPGVTAEVVNQFLANAQTQDSVEWLEGVQGWARQNAPDTPVRKD